MFNQIGRMSVAVLLGWGVLFAGGCGCSPKSRSFNVEVQVGQTLKDGSGKVERRIDVSMTGLNEFDEKWNEARIREFFKPESRKNKQADHKDFAWEVGSAGDSSTFKMGDKVWAPLLKRGSKHLVVLMYLSGSGGVAKSVQFPLNQCRWEGDKIVVRLHKDRITVETKEKPVEK